MKKSLFFLILAFFPFFLFAQKEYKTSSAQTLVFKLTEAEADSFYRHGFYPKERHFHSLVDSFLFSEKYNYSKTGHYLFANVIGEEVFVNLKSHNLLSAKTRNNKRDFSLQVIDNLGINVNNAKVFLEDKEIPFHEKTDSYLLKKWNKGGLLKIIAQGETLYYSVSREDNRWILKKRFARFNRTLIGRILSKPYQIGRNIFSYFKRSISYGDFSIYNWKRLIPFYNFFTKRRRQKGYIVLNQPKYQPGDTVKVKAYVTKHSGKPLKRELDLEFRQSGRYGSKYFSKEIKSISAGAYVYDFVLGDSLKLDKNYNISIGKELNISFKLEDYQLDEVDWKFSSVSEKYEGEEKVIFKAQGVDKNGNSIPDGEVELFLFSNTISQFYDTLVYVPDTLWRFQTALKSRGETQIIVPDSLLPLVDMHVNAVAKFQNSNGELAEKIVHFSFDKKKKYFKTNIANGSLSIIYKEKQKTKKINAMLCAFSIENKKCLEEKVILPLKREINPNFHHYTIQVGEDTKRIGFNNSGTENLPQVSVNGQLKKDSLFVLFNNPNKTLINYIIQTKNKTIFRGKTKESRFVFSKKSSQNSIYYVKYNFVWGGKVIEKETEIRNYKKLLKIVIDQPNKVNPGETTTVKINVSESNGKPAKKVNLTAGAINAQFDNLKPYKAPNVSYKIGKNPLEFNSFNLRKSNKSPSKEKMNLKWYDAFGLDSFLFYNARFENEGGLMHYDTIRKDTFSKNLAQFAPYIIENGEAQSVFLIYCNRKLVYYYDTNDNPPYSFVGQEGYNRISVRTRDFEYTMDSVLLKKGHKLELFIDAKNYKKASFIKHISVKSVPNELTNQEKEVLSVSIFSFKGMPHNKKAFLWQNETNIHVLNNLPLRNRYKQSAYKIGPFSSNTPLNYLRQNEFLNHFRFESGYSYEIQNQKERLYKVDLFPSKKKMILSDNLPLKKMGEVVFTEGDIIMKKSRTERPYFNKTDFGFKDKKNRLRFDFTPPIDSIILFVLLKNVEDSTALSVSPNTRRFYNLKTGKHELSVFTKNGYYISKTIDIQEYSTNYLDLNQSIFEKDKKENILNFYIYSPATKQKKYSQNTLSFHENKRTGIIGNIKTLPKQNIDNRTTIEVSQHGVIMAVTDVDLEGNYSIFLPSGVYDIEIKNKKYPDTYINDFFLQDSTFAVFDWLLHYEKSEEKPTNKEGYTLTEVEVISYAVPLVEQDNTTQGMTLMAKDIRNLPSKSINGIASATAGISSSDLEIRGSRSSETFYYIDGIRVSGDLIPQSEIKEENSTNVPLSYNSLSGTITEEETGESLIGVTVLLQQNGSGIIGTVTDIDGNYYFEQTPYGNFTIIVSYTGFASKTIENLTPGNNQNITLSSAGVELEEVIIVGYGQASSSSKQDLNLDNLDETTPLTGIQLRQKFKDHAYWQPNLLTDKNGETFYTITYPDNITSWHTFVLGMDKKKRGGTATENVQSFKPLLAQLALPRFLIEGDETEIIGKSVNYTKQNFDIKTEFLLGETSLKTNQATIKDALVETAKLTATKEDSLSLTYRLSMDDYGDGEKRQIPVFQVGTKETVGVFQLLKGDTILNLNFDPKLGNVTLRAEKDVLNLLIHDLKYLRNYEYGCNEQTASKLTALLLEKETAAKLKRPFEHEKLIKKCIVQLNKSQNENGSWGWWINNPYDVWMTTYVLRALERAKRGGYPVSSFENGLRWVTANLNSLNGKNLLFSLEFLSDIGQNMEFESHLERLDSINVPMFEHLTEMKIRQTQNLEFTLDSLSKYRKETLFGGSFWGTDSYHWFNNELQLTRLAFHIFDKEGNEEMKQNIIQFFLEKRSRNHHRRFGRNTFETAQVLALLLPEILEKEEGENDLKNSLSLSGNFEETITKFPFETTFLPNKSLKINKSGNGTVFFTAYQTFFNTDPKPKKDLYAITTKMLQEGKEVKNLKQGVKTTMQVTVNVVKDSEYIMIEIPIPGACSYFNKFNSNYRSQEVHREYFKEKTSIFCRSLPIGEHTFTLELEPRFSGQYTVNPVRVEQMYFPIFYGRNAVEKVLVE